MRGRQLAFLAITLLLAGCGGSDAEPTAPRGITATATLTRVVSTPSATAQGSATPRALSMGMATSPAAGTPGNDPAVSRLTFSLLVSARDVDKEAAPLDRTDRFPADAERIYVVAHLSGGGEAEVMIRWVAVEAAGVERDKVILERSIQAAAGDRYGFYMEPPVGGRFPAGRYQADLYLDGQLAETVPFTVFAATVATATVVADPTVQPDQRVIAVLARGVTDDFEPYQPTTVFTPDTETIHLVFTAQNLPGGSALEAVWIAERVDADVPPDFEIDRASLLVRGTAPGDFTLSRPTTGFPTGRYRVELFLGETLIGVYPFTVE